MQFIRDSVNISCFVSKVTHTSLWCVASVTVIDTESEMSEPSSIPGRNGLCYFYFFLICLPASRGLNSRTNAFIHLERKENWI